MATVYKRGTTWWVRFGWQGQEIRRSARTTSKSEAREYLQELQAQYRTLGLGGAPRVPFRQAAIAYLEEDVSKKKASTIAFYQNCVKVLAEEFGDMYIDELTRSKIAAFEASKGKEVSASRLKHYRASMSGIFKVALRHEWVERNPCRDLDPIAVNNARNLFLTQKQWLKLKGELEDPLLGIAEVSVLRGMRLGEILGMRWSDLNEGQDTLTIQDTKGNRPRVIPMEEALEVFQRQSRISKFIFTNRNGNRMAVNETSRAFKRALKRAKLDQFTFHDLRHTYASWYVQRGGDMYKLQRILGHKGPAMTQRYAHLRVDDLRNPAQNPAQRTGDFSGQVVDFN